MVDGTSTRAQIKHNDDVQRENERVRGHRTEWEWDERGGGGFTFSFGWVTAEGPGLLLVSDDGRDELAAGPKCEGTEPTLQPNSHYYPNPRARRATKGTFVKGRDRGPS